MTLPSVRPMHEAAAARNSCSTRQRRGGSRLHPCEASPRGSSSRETVGAPRVGFEPRAPGQAAQSAAKDTWRVSARASSELSATSQLSQNSEALLSLADFSLEAELTDEAVSLRSRLEQHWLRSQSRDNVREDNVRGLRRGKRLDENTSESVSRTVARRRRARARPRTAEVRPFPRCAHSLLWGACLPACAPVADSGLCTCRRWP